MAPPDASSIRCHCRPGLKVPEEHATVFWTEQALSTLARRDACARRCRRVTQPRKGPLSLEKGKDVSMVFVLDRHKKPLMPTTPKRARLLLERGRAVVHRSTPFVIRLKDRCVQDFARQEVVLKIDPGSQTTGVALARVEKKPEGQVHHALFLCEVNHRGEQVHRHKITQVQARRRRRSANLLYRAPRFLQRGIKPGWLPPSIRSRVDNILTWSARLARWCPLRQLEVEQVRFDTQLLQNPEIAGIAYQEGTLAGWEVRAYLLHKYQYRCAYCVTPVTGHHLSREQSLTSYGNGSMLSVSLVTERPTRTIV